MTSSQLEAKPVEQKFQNFVRKWLKIAPKIPHHSKSSMVTRGKDR
jgi:hypothetical protein